MSLFAHQVALFSVALTGPGVSNWWIVVGYICKLGSGLTCLLKRVVSQLFFSRIGSEKNYLLIQSSVFVDWLHFLLWKFGLEVVISISGGGAYNLGQSYLLVVCCLSLYLGPP